MRPLYYIYIYNISISYPLIHLYISLYIHLLKQIKKKNSSFQNIINNQMMLTIKMINLFLLSLLSISSAQPLPKLLASLNKDPTTSLYTMLLNSKDPYVVDIAAPFSWRRCPSVPRPAVFCFTAECTQAQYLPSPCPPPPTSIAIPCKCMVTPRNPRTGSCEPAQLTYTNLTVQGSHFIMSDIYLSCAPNPLFKSLPKGVVGLASLSLAPLSLQNQFSGRLPRLTRGFAMCLPSTSSRNGVISFGNETHHLLSYTPLLTNPKNADYAIGIKGLSVGTSSVSAMSPLEGIRLSTVVPYTTLATDLYTKFVEVFEEGMKGVPKMKSVEPFTACYEASAVVDGARVPRIDLEFDGGKNWTILGANSMKRVSGDTACLAFVDGGAAAALKIVIGAFQMEDNLLVFDLDRSRLGFSSSLLVEGMSCSNFKFTT
ncbi:chitinase CLP-like [Salvia miltiorrhiza]|uniref:chitinase CLP-like n=1 Tax=Salvia miltiorrhiza TaxID=226208 RepID=UPI0025ABF8B8|nr:chitinase CLP-like [Salvia miltiorrhiza]